MKKQSLKIVGCIKSTELRNLEICFCNFNLKKKLGKFPPVQTGPGAHPASCKMGTGSFPEVKCGRGVLLTTHPLLVPRSWKSRTIILSTPWATPSL